MGAIGGAWVSVSPDLGKFGAEASAGIKAALKSQNPRVKVGADTTGAAADIGALQKYIEGQDVGLQLSTAAASAKLTAMSLQADALKSRLADITPNIKDASALASIAAIDTALEAAKAKASSIDLSVGGAGAVTAANALSRQFATLRNSAANVASALEAANAEADNSGEIARRAAAGWFSLNGAVANIGAVSVPLFAGALGDAKAAIVGGDSVLPGLTEHLVNSASGFHLATEAVIEFVAIWGPAAVAVTAFGLAATPEIKAIGTQLDNMHTAATGTGQAFGSLATSGASVTQSVKPSILEAFGIALDTAKNGSGQLGGALSTLGSGFDVFAAKASIALGGGSGGFMKQGTADALALTQSFAELGDILGTVMKAVPGYAEVLLGFGNDALGMGAKVVSAIEPVLAIFLKLHGAVLYGGLFGTLGAKLASGVISGTVAAAGAVSNMAASILGDENLISRGAGNVVVALEDMSAGPVIAGIGLLAGAVAAVVIYLKASKSAAESFNSTIQQSISAASITSLQTALGSGISQTASQYNAALGTMATAGKNLHVTSKTSISDAAQIASEARGAGHALYEAAGSAASYQAGLNQLDTQQANFRANLTEVAAALGLQGSASSKSAQALSILEGAQVSASQATSKSAGNTQVLNVMASAYATTLATLTAGTGTLNEALNALGVTQSAQITDAQKVTAAYTSWIQIVTGGDSAFTTFEQGQNTLSSAMTGAGDSITEVAGKISQKLTVTNAALNGTSQSALAARQAFDSQIESGVTLYGNLQTLAAASDDTTTAQTALAASGKDIVAQMLPMARGSAEATAELYSLAQIAGYGGADSFQALSKWVGSTTGAEASLNQQQTILTLGAANLTAAEKNLNSALNTAATTMQAQAIAKTVNLQQVTDELASSVENGGRKFTATSLTLAGQYYEALIRSGDGANQAKQDTDAFLKRLGATTGVVQTVNSALAKLPSKVSISVDTVVSASGAVKALESGGAGNLAHALLGELQFSGMAAGGTVSGGIHGRDSVPALLAPGELVVPASHAALFGDMARRASVPGFAAGGTVGTSLSDITGGLASIVPTAGAAMGSFAQSTGQAFVNSVKTAAASMVTGVLPGAAPLTSPVVAQLIAEALSADSAPASWLPAIELMVSKESGGNANAIDPITVLGEHATGLMQMLPTTFGMYSHGNIMNPLTNLEAAIRYIEAQYGSPFNIQGIGRAGTYRGYSGGGAINEPVNGVGLWSGMGYSFAENGQPEYVSNGSQMTAANTGADQMVRLPLQQIASTLASIQRQNAALPNVIGRAIGQTSGAGYRSGYYSAQG